MVEATDDGRDMLELQGLNWWAIAVAAVVFFGLAAVWYQPAVMGRKWMAAAGVDPESEGGPNPLMFLITLIIYFIMAIVLAMIARGIDASTFGDALTLGLSTGIAFIALQAWINANYEGRPMGLVIANGGIGIIGLTAMAIIITLWT